MAHQHSEHRQHHVEKRRVAHLTRHYASGGAVHEDEPEDKALVKRMVKRKALKADGGPVKHRADRPGRKRGGRMNAKKASTTVNVITGHPPVAGLGGAMPPGAAPMAPLPMAAAPMPPHPPMMAGPPPGVTPGGPPMMPPHKNGGRAYKKGGRVGVNAGSKVYEDGVKAGTQVSHDKGKNDGKDLHRGRVITYRNGGRIKRATGGPIYAPEKGGMGPDMDAGAGGGKGRLEKARMAKRA